MRDLGSSRVCVCGGRCVQQLLLSCLNAHEEGALVQCLDRVASASDGTLDVMVTFTGPSAAGKVCVCECVRLCHVWPCVRVC